MINDDDKEVKEETEYNNRLPEFVSENETSKKLFTKGWKFNMFNEMGQFWKQISAACVIFSMIYFSLIGIFNGNESQTFCILTLVYSMICLFSFFNLTYVRDFDALQINFMPVALTLIALVQNGDFALYGLTATLMMDAYYGMRYRDESDKIEFTPIELFSQ